MRIACAAASLHTLQLLGAPHTQPSPAAACQHAADLGQQALAAAAHAQRPGGNAEHVAAAKEAAQLLQWLQGQLQEELRQAGLRARLPGFQGGWDADEWASEEEAGWGSPAEDAAGSVSSADAASRAAPAQQQPPQGQHASTAMLAGQAEHHHASKNGSAGQHELEADTAAEAAASQAAAPLSAESPAAAPSPAAAVEDFGFDDADDGWGPDGGFSTSHEPRADQQQLQQQAADGAQKRGRQGAGAGAVQQLAEQAGRAAAAGAP